MTAPQDKISNLQSAIPNHIRALIVEDVEDDALLLVRELQKGGYAVDWQRVETAEQFRAALLPSPWKGDPRNRTGAGGPGVRVEPGEGGEVAWDIVFCDYSLPRFSGPDALEIYTASGLDIPFILVSGTVGEDKAVGMIKAGADDFILKGNWARLLPVVERELLRAAARRKQQQQMAALARSLAPQKRRPRLSPKILLALGALLLALAGAWKFALAPRWVTLRLPPGWTWRETFISVQTFPDPATGQFPQTDTPAVYDRTVANLGPAEGGAGVRLEDAFTTYDPATGQITWEYVTQAVVDSRTGEHLAPEYRGDYAVFPRRAQKTTYRLRANYLKGIPVAFQAEEEIEGLLTYLYAYKGRGEYTKSYAGTDQYPGVPVEAGQEIKCADDQLIIKAWVEPLTGEMLKVEEACYSGDYIYDIASGQPLAAILRWGGVTTGDDVLLRAQAIRRDRAALLWADVYAPGLLALAGLAALGVGVRQAAVGRRQ